MPRAVLPSLRAAGLALTVSLTPAATTRAAEEPRPPAPAGDAEFAQKLLAARRANAEAQRAGRPSVWMAVPRSSKPTEQVTGRASTSPDDAEPGHP